MKGSEALMLGFMEGADKRYIIPVYQRKYDWKEENCRQLYEDLKKIVTDKRDSHFFGSIVSSVVPNGSKIEYHIIDGQQRLTTVSLLLLAIKNLVSKGIQLFFLISGNPTIRCHSNDIFLILLSLSFFLLGWNNCNVSSHRLSPPLKYNILHILEVYLILLPE